MAENIDRDLVLHYTGPLREAAQSQNAQEECISLLPSCIPMDNDYPR